MKLLLFKSFQSFPVLISGSHPQSSSDRTLSPSDNHDIDVIHTMRTRIYRNLPVCTTPFSEDTDIVSSFFSYYSQKYLNTQIMMMQNGRSYS